MSEAHRTISDPSPTADREILISHRISAAPERVFEAFTDVCHLRHWWGPDGFTTTTRDFAFREGGEWIFVMHGPDGTDYPEWISWTTIRPPEYLEFRHGERPDDPNAFISMITFIPEDGATRLEMRTVFPTREQRDVAVERYHAIDAGRQTLGALDAYVTGALNQDTE